jgi:hypothetical protein
MDSSLVSLKQSKLQKPIEDKIDNDFSTDNTDMDRNMERKDNVQWGKVGAGAE